VRRLSVMSSILSTFEPSRVTTKYSKAGRITAQVLHHTGDASGGFGTLRAQGRAKGLSGSALKEWIYAQSSGDAAQAARTEARVLFNLALDRGHVPQRTEVSQSSGNMVFRLIPEAKEPKTKTITCVDPVAMVATLSPEQRAALLAALQA
jgi:precorrin-6x reductase